MDAAEYESYAKRGKNTHILLSDGHSRVAYAADMLKRLNMADDCIVTPIKILKLLVCTRIMC